MRPSLSPLLRRCLLATAAGVILLGGCSSDGNVSPVATAPVDATVAAPPTATAPHHHRVAPEAPPRSGVCYRLSPGQVRRPTNDSTPSSCTRPHTAQTYYVGVMPKGVVENMKTPDTAAIANYVTPRCDQRFAAHVSGGTDTRILSRLQPVWFVPGQRQLAHGARWFRCDVVGFAAAHELARLPTRTAGVLAQPGSLDTYGLCSTAPPGGSGEHQVMCSRPHTWQAFSVIHLGDRTATWPGDARLRAARQLCKTQARAHQGYPLRWTYGWQRPTHAQWRDGRHWGYCWSPQS